VSISVLISFLKVLSDIIPREVDPNIFVLGDGGVNSASLTHIKFLETFLRISEMF